MAMRSSFFPNSAKASTVLKHKEHTVKKGLTKEAVQLISQLNSSISVALYTSFREWESEHRTADTDPDPDMALVEYIDLLRGIVTIDAKDLKICKELEERDVVKIIACTGDKVVVRVPGVRDL